MGRKILIALLFFCVIVVAVVGLIFNFKKDETTEEEEVAEGSQNQKDAGRKVRSTSSGKSQNRTGDRSSEEASGQQGQANKEVITDAEVVE